MDSRAYHMNWLCIGGNLLSLIPEKDPHRLGLMRDMMSREFTPEVSIFSVNLKQRILNKRSKMGGESDHRYVDSKLIKTLVG